MSNSSMIRAALIAVCLPAALCGCTSGTTKAESPAMADGQRGGLLYGTACVACHTTQAHWRDKSLVHSWGDLVYQVNRWQGVAGLNWSATDINDVATYLNERFYRLPGPAPG